jgi:hypothetical protein
MRGEICGIIVPRHEEILYGSVGRAASLRGQAPELAECVLPPGHTCDCHVFKTPEGQFIRWEDDWDCGCCEPEEDDRCYTYCEISLEEFKKLGGEERT